MKISLTVVLLFLSSIVSSQQAKSIKFEHGLTWSQIKAKAKKENKYIFLDGFTTWCVPCKVMAAEIFPQPEVAAYFNSRFINVAVQFDRTNKDNQQVRNWYKDAKLIFSNYKIDSYPTYLFFDPNGRLVNTVKGSSASAGEFIAKAKEAFNPLTQYNSLKNQYEKGNREPAFLLALIHVAQQANENRFFPVVTNTYLATQKELLKEENIKLLAISTTKSTDPGFKILQRYGDRVDSIVGKGQSSSVIRTIAFDETVLPLLRAGGTKTDYGNGMVMYSGEVNKSVNWTEIKARLDQSYPQFSQEIILTAKPVYYQWLNDWPAYSEAVSSYVSQYGDKVDKKLLNTFAWAVFGNCTDQKCLEQAAVWSKQLLSGADASSLAYQYIHAGLLYKSGRKNEGIAVIENAVKLSQGKDKQLLAILDKMKKDEKIW